MIVLMPDSDSTRTGVHGRWEPPQYNRRTLYGQPTGAQSVRARCGDSRFLRIALSRSAPLPYLEVKESHE